MARRGAVVVHTRFVRACSGRARGGCRTVRWVRGCVYLVKAGGRRMLRAGTSERGSHQPKRGAARRGRGGADGLVRGRDGR